MPVGYSQFHRKVGRKFTAKRGRSTRGRYRKNVGSLSRKFGGRAGRYAGRKRTRYGGFRMKSGKAMKSRRNNVLYQTVLKHGLTQESIELDSFSGTLSKIGNSLQDECQWVSIPMETQVSTFDRILAASINTAITSVNVSQQAFLERVDNRLAIRNNGHHCAYVIVYKCYPRIDIPSGVSVRGVNPTQFTTGFTNTLTEYKASSAVSYADYNATPFMSTTWCSMFKMKPIKRKYLQPGGEFTLKYSKPINYVVKKSKYGISDASSFATEYEHTRRNGPLYLVKAYGSIVHDNSTITWPTSSSSSMPSGTANYKPTYGGFLVDFVFNTKVVYRAPLLLTNRTQGVYTQLPAIAAATNEQQVTTFDPAKQAP